MSLKLHNQSLVSSSYSNPWHSQPVRTYFFNGKAIILDHLLFNWGYSRKRCGIRLYLLGSGNLSADCRKGEGTKHSFVFFKSRRMRCLLPFASADDIVAVNEIPQMSASTDVEELSGKFDQSLQGEDYNMGLVQALHDAARVFELSIKEQCSLSKISWFSTAWLGIEKNAWVKELSYQASVYSLLQAAIEISSRGDERDKVIHVFVQRSLLRLSAPLESVSRDKFSTRQPEAFEWFWSQQVPTVITTFVDYFEKDQHFATTAVYVKGVSSGAGSGTDISLLMLALSCIAATTKLGPTKVSCAQFFSMIPDITGRLLDMLLEFIPVHQAYHCIKDIGLFREFLLHFGPRAAACRLERGNEEIVFWVSLVQKQLRRAIDRERIWSRLTTSESIEVLERDLAIFGFFIALGRSSQSFLFANGCDAVDKPIEEFTRFLIGGSVLYYPQLSSISSYQLYVEVVCEELGWLPFYPGNVGISASKGSHGHKNKREGAPNAEAILLILDVCSHWIQSFIKYSKWLESPSNIKAAKFLSKGHDKLKLCMEELGLQKNQTIENTVQRFSERNGSITYSLIKKEPDSFDKALEGVEEALMRLEGLLQKLHVTSSGSEKEHLKAACTDLERIRKLKKEAEFFEASFRAKAASLQQGDDDNSSPSISEKQQYCRSKDRASTNFTVNKGSKSRGLWSFSVPLLSRKSDSVSSAADETDNERHTQATTNIAGANCNSNEICRFEVLRTELIELKKRVQKSVNQYECDEDETKMADGSSTYTDESEGVRLVEIQKKQSIIEKSLDKLKDTSMNVWQGTQLLAIDVSAALWLLRRVLIGDVLTDKEKQALQRTLTDLASVVPIGFLMLLPVTAVGHAAILAAIQRYAPTLIPSTYGPERLDLLRQLEKVKEMESTELRQDENANI